MPAVTRRSIPTRTWNIPQRKAFRIKEVDPRLREPDPLIDVDGEPDPVPNPEGDPGEGLQVPDFSKMTDEQRQAWIDKMKEGDPALKALLEREGDRRVEQSRATMEQRIMKQVRKDLEDQRQAEERERIQANGSTEEKMKALEERNAQLERERIQVQFRADVSEVLVTAGTPELLEVLSAIHSGESPSLESITELVNRYKATRDEAVIRTVAKNLGTPPTPPGQPPSAPPSGDKSIMDMSDAEYEEARKQYPAAQN